jgi:transposase
MSSPAPVLRAFFLLRVRDRRGQPIAIVATARKPAGIVSYVLARGEPFAWDRPALTVHKMCAQELPAGMPARQEIGRRL